MTKNKFMKYFITFLFLTVCIAVSAQQPHFSREKPHKPKPVPRNSLAEGKMYYRHCGQTYEIIGDAWVPMSEIREVSMGCELMYPEKDTPFPRPMLLKYPDCNSYIAQINAMQLLQDSLTRKLTDMYTFYNLAKPIVENLIVENRAGTMHIAYVDEWDLKIAIRKYRKHYKLLEQ